jgi:signal transduction histidine kinase
LRLFLTCLVGFLVVLILILIFLLRTNLARTEEAIDRSHQMVADVAAEMVDRTPPEALATELLLLRGRFEIAGISVVSRDGRTTESGARNGDLDAVTRLAGPGTLTLRFDAARRSSARRDFLVTAAICIAAASFGAALLFFYLPRITQPIEQMLDDARSLGPGAGDQEETAFLVATFRKSISTLKAQEEELKQLHEREKTRADDLERVTATLTRSLTSGFLAVDAAGDIVDINAAGREILGLDAAAPMAGTALSEAVPLQVVEAALRSAFEQRAAMTRMEIEDVNPVTGERVVVGLTTVPLRNDADAFLGLLGLFTDLTGIRSLEARVQEMTTLAQLGEISAGIAHEFRNSLHTITGYMKLARKTGIGETGETRLQSAEKEASLLLQAIERLLAFARPVQLNAEKVNLRGILSEQIAQLAEMDGGLDVTLQGPDTVVDGDRVLLSRAFDNLLRNAADAVRQKGGGSIRVTLRDETLPSVTIADTGVGFEPADAARLVLPFQSNKPGGFGMGLPLARKIVLLHGATFRLTGEAGKGAVVTIEFAGAVGSRSA